MTQAAVAILILLASIVIILLGYNIPKGRIILMSIGFYMLMTGAFASYSNWLPQTRGEVPEEARPVSTGDLDKMTPEQLAEMGETIIFGKVGGFTERGIGKGQCPLCHTFKAGDIGDRAPNLIGIGKRAEEEIKGPRYLKPDTVQTEAHPGSGRATTAAEYIAESHSCPSCFVVVGFGVKGTNDRESPMPVIHKPPIALSIEELIAVDTWLFVREGLEAPPVSAIRAAYEKFIPEKDRATVTQVKGPEPPTPPGPPIALGTDTPEQIIMKMQCFICHQIPTIAVAKFGMIGPVLIEGHSAPKRLASPEYQARLKAGKATAKTPKAYVMESIVHPNAFIAPAFVLANNPEVSPMLQDFAQKFTFGALEKLADFLLTLDCNAAMKDGLKGPPQESVDKVCGPSGKTAEAPLKATQLLTTLEEQERDN